MHFLSVCWEKNSAHFHKNVNPPMGVSPLKRLDHEININHLTINIFSTCLPLKVRNKTENPFISPLRRPIEVLLSLKIHTESCLDPENHTESLKHGKFLFWCTFTAFDEEGRTGDTHRPIALVGT
jgi:hypothetical protein